MLSDSVKEQLDKQFVLVYTGQRRLAKRILRDIMGAYMLRKEQVVQSLHEIQKIALSMKSALVKGNLALVGRLMQHHWEVNKILDPGTSNSFIESIFKVCEFVYGAKLLAGGGGFIELILRESVTVDLLMKNWQTPFRLGVSLANYYYL